jgi:lysophospholipase L1-like esterase
MADGVSGNAGGHRRRSGSLRRRTVVASIAVGVLGLAAPPASATLLSGEPDRHQAPQPLVVGLGDSALTNQDCGCSDFLDVYAALAGRRIGTDIRARNEAQAGTTSKDMLANLRSRRVRKEVEAADVVVVFTGANDFYDAFTKVGGGGSARKEYGPIAETLRGNVSAAIEAVHHRNPRARIVVCGYWNDFKSGSVAKHEYTEAQRRAADSATDYTNGALHTVAARADVRYVSTRKLFQRQHDITPLLASDGDHLSAAGHRLVATALVDLLHPSSPSPSIRSNPTPAAPAPAPAAPAQPPVAPAQPPAAPPEAPAPAPNTPPDQPVGPPWVLPLLPRSQPVP